MGSLKWLEDGYPIALPHKARGGIQQLFEPIIPNVAQQTVQVSHSDSHAPPTTFTASKAVVPGMFHLP